MAQDLVRLLADWQQAIRRQDKLRHLHEDLVRLRLDGVQLRIATLEDVEVALQQAGADLQTAQDALDDLRAAHPVG